MFTGLKFCTVLIVSSHQLDLSQLTASDPEEAIGDRKSSDRGVLKFLFSKFVSMFRYNAEMPVSYFHYIS